MAEAMLAALFCAVGPSATAAATKCLADACDAGTKSCIAGACAPGQPAGASGSPLHEHRLAIMALLLLLTPLLLLSLLLATAAPPLLRGILVRRGLLHPKLRLRCRLTPSRLVFSAYGVQLADQQLASTICAYGLGGYVPCTLHRLEIDEVRLVVRLLPLLYRLLRPTSVCTHPAASAAAADAAAAGVEVPLTVPPPPPAAPPPTAAAVLVEMGTLRLEHTDLPVAEWASEARRSETIGELESAKEAALLLHAQLCAAIAAAQRSREAADAAAPPSEPSLMQLRIEAIASSAQLSFAGLECALHTAPASLSARAYGVLVRPYKRARGDAAEMGATIGMSGLELALAPPSDPSRDATPPIGSEIAAEIASRHFVRWMGVRPDPELRSPFDEAAGCAMVMRVGLQRGELGTAPSASVSLSFGLVSLDVSPLHIALLRHATVGYDGLGSWYASLAGQVDGGAAEGDEGVRALAAELRSLGLPRGGAAPGPADGGAAPAPAVAAEAGDADRRRQQLLRTLPYDVALAALCDDSAAQLVVGLAPRYTPPPHAATLRECIDLVVKRRITLHLSVGEIEIRFLQAGPPRANEPCDADLTPVAAARVGRLGGGPVPQPPPPAAAARSAGVVVRLVQPEAGTRFISASVVGVGVVDLRHDTPPAQFRVLGPGGGAGGPSRADAAEAEASSPKPMIRAEVEMTSGRQNCSIALCRWSVLAAAELPSLMAGCAAADASLLPLHPEPVPARVLKGCAVPSGGHEWPPDLPDEQPPPAAAAPAAAAGAAPHPAFESLMLLGGNRLELGVELSDLGVVLPPPRGAPEGWTVGATISATLDVDSSEGYERLALLLQPRLDSGTLLAPEPPPTAATDAQRPAYCLVPCAGLAADTKQSLIRPTELSLQYAAHAALAPGLSTGPSSPASTASADGGADAPAASRPPHSSPSNSSLQSIVSAPSGPAPSRLERMVDVRMEPLTVALSLSEMHAIRCALADASSRAASAAPSAADASAEHPCDEGVAPHAAHTPRAPRTPLGAREGEGADHLSPSGHPTPPPHADSAAVPSSWLAIPASGSLRPKMDLSMWSLRFLAKLMLLHRRREQQRSAAAGSLLSTPLFLQTGARLAFGAISVRLEADRQAGGPPHPHDEAPLALLEMTISAISADLGLGQRRLCCSSAASLRQLWQADTLRGSLRVSLHAGYLNRRLSVFEPFLEPWQLCATAHKEDGEQDCSFRVRAGSLNLNVSRALLLLARSIDFSASSHANPLSVRPPPLASSSFTISNASGVPLRVALRAGAASHAGGSRASRGIDWRVLPASMSAGGEDATLTLSPPPPSPPRSPQCSSSPPPPPSRLLWLLVCSADCHRGCACPAMPFLSEVCICIFDSRRL